ncbi:unnamed protein product [Symbiodinium sp. CCMP2592]|nr:unnamed protein product [Symbiodinium sp. CCMP2592]
MSTTDILSITLSLGWRTTPVSPGLWRSALKTLQNDPTVPNLQPLFADVLLAAVLVGMNDQHAAPTLKGLLKRYPASCIYRLQVEAGWQCHRRRAVPHHLHLPTCLLGQNRPLQLQLHVRNFLPVNQAQCRRADACFQTGPPLGQSFSRKNWRHKLRLIAAGQALNSAQEQGEELKRRAEQALKAAKYRGASPETRKRYEVEQAFGDRASKALSEALARQSGDPAAERVLVGAPVEQELTAWDSAEYHMPEDIGMWDEAHYADPEFGHWMGEMMEVGYAVDPDSAETLPEECYDSVAWVQDATSSGYTRAWGMGSEECAEGPSSGSSLRGANHSQWASKRHGGHARTEESEVRAWAETTTAASSNRSVASAADSNSENGQVHEDADDDADELLASCFRSVTGAT